MNIESTLEPLFRNGRFIVNEELKGSPEGELLVEQFIFFSRKYNKNRKDDIPDATAKGASLLNREMTSMKFTQWPMFYRRGTRVTF